MNDGNLLTLPSADPNPGFAPSTSVGTMLDWNDGHGPLVDYPDNPHGPLVARSIVPLARTDAERIIDDRRGLVLAFEQGRSDQPIILGIVTAPSRHGEADPRSVPSPGSQELGPVDAVVDGRRIRLEGHDEIELCCGEASITLRRNGRVVIRGTYVETRSRGTNRIRGATVEVN
ncbi:MAG: hypothetical protein K0V04_08800 [Deltaproteobacteria bacterium]|nr:hypothetical protein [Deltaproteobacteria bacterium]